MHLLFELNDSKCQFRSLRHVVVTGIIKESNAFEKICQDEVVMDVAEFKTFSRSNPRSFIDFHCYGAHLQ